MEVDKKLQKAILTDMAKRKAGIPIVENGPVDYSSEAFAKEINGDHVLITEESLKKQKEDEIKSRQLFQDEYQKQLIAWSEIDESGEYNSIDFFEDEYLVRIFSMDVSQFQDIKTNYFDWSPILKKFTIKEKQQGISVFPVIKILKIGKKVDPKNILEPQGLKYNVGDICVVSSHEILGEDWNPAFMSYMGMQEQRSQGMTPKIPEGLRQRIPNVEKNWDRYQFIRPWVAKPEEKDYLTYLIPSSKIKGLFNV